MLEYAVSLLKEMVEHYSPTGREAALAHFLFEKLRTLDLKTHIDQAGNVIGEFGSKGPTILLCGHIDTVPGKLPVKLEEGKLYGRGVVDAKASLAAMVTTASILSKEEFPGKLIVAGVVDEEGKSRGTRQLIKDGVKADYAIFGEPSGVDKLTIAYKGSLHLRISVKTNTGHSAAPWLFENAVERAFEIYGLLKAIRLPLKRKNSKFYSLTSSLTKMMGGSFSSQIPSKCLLHIDFRFPPQTTPIQLLSEVKQVIKKYTVGKPMVAVQVEVLDATEPYEADTDSLLIRAFSWAIRMVNKKPATWVRKTGTGDMNLFGAAKRIPIITYGAGDSRLDHTSNEWIDLKEFEASVHIFYKGIIRLIELHKKRTKT